MQCQIGLHRMLDKYVNICDVFVVIVKSLRLSSALAYPCLYFRSQEYSAPWRHLGLDDTKLYIVLEVYKVHVIDDGGAPHS